MFKAKKHTHQTEAELKIEFSNVLHSYIQKFTSMDKELTSKLIDIYTFINQKNNATSATTSNSNTTTSNSSSTTTTSTPINESNL
jgi:hypothetical protein